MKIVLGADHGGLDIKSKLIEQLRQTEHEVEDLGPFSPEHVDYPDYALEAARRVADEQADTAVLICRSGLGMSIAANKVPGVRAGLCCTPGMAVSARTHNHANALCIGADLVSADEAADILSAWLETSWETGGRHERRVGKITSLEINQDAHPAVRAVDPDIYEALRAEGVRQKQNIELIASENYADKAVREAQGSLMTNKYAEGYPGKRWYHGCEHVDTAEQLAIDRARELFGAEHANVQPHSGSTANMAVYFAMLQPGDPILAMDLSHGGHLTHGNPINFSGRFFTIIPYGVDRETECIDYDEMERLAVENKPRLICCGASAYSRVIDFARIREIADKVGAYLMADIAHIAGLVAGGAHPSPVPHCDFVTTTTHKTLRGPRGGLILCREKFAKDINKMIFPGVQGGPLMHAIAAKAIAFHEAMQPEFREYAHQIVRNARALAETLTEQGIRIVSGGTENHCFLVDLNAQNLTGRDAATLLDRARITVNKNAIPFDSRSPFVTSGIRIGTPAVTTRGMKEDEMRTIGEFIGTLLNDPENDDRVQDIRRRVVDFTDPFPVP